jgi:hypothetical protein
VAILLREGVVLRFHGFDEATLCYTNHHYAAVVVSHHSPRELGQERPWTDKAGRRWEAGDGLPGETHFARESPGTQHSSSLGDQD